MAGQIPSPQSEMPEICSESLSGDSGSHQPAVTMAMKPGLHPQSEHYLKELSSDIISSFLIGEIWLLFVRLLQTLHPLMSKKVTKTLCRREEREDIVYHSGFLLSLDFLRCLLNFPLQVGTATISIHLVLGILLLTTTHIIRR